MQTNKIKTANRGFLRTGYTADELAQRLDEVLINQKASDEVVKEFKQKHPERFKLKTPIASEQKIAERILAADAADIRHVPTDKKHEALFKEYKAMVEREKKVQPNWDRIGKGLLASMGVEPTKWETVAPHWAKEENEE